MSDDTKQLLRYAAPHPSSTPDFDELWSRGRRQRRTGQAAGVLTVLAAVGLVVLMLTTVLPASPSGLEVAGQPPTSQPAGTADVEVLGKLTGAPLSIGHVAAAWTDTPEGAAALWSEFHLVGSPPELDDRALILAATGESSSCPSELETVEVDDGRLFLQIVDRSRTSPAPTDAPCHSDFNPITFVLRTDTSVLSPPFIVDFGQTSVRLDTPGAVAFADYGERAPDQLAQLDADEFEVLAAAATKDASLKGMVFRGDPTYARRLWEMAALGGTAPTLPDGTVGVFVIARDAESTCRSPQDVIGVEIVDRAAVVVLDPDGQFLQPCPGPPGAHAFTAFVVAIPARYDDNLTGARSRLGEPVAGPSKSETPTQLAGSQATVPREPTNEFADIATTAADARTVWRRFNLTGQPPQTDFGTAALLFVGFGESGSCPARFDGMSVDGDRVDVAIGTEGGPSCTDDYNPRTIVLEVARDALPDGGFELTVSGRTFVLTSEPLSEPPRYGDAIVGRLTSESPQLSFDAQPPSVPRRGRVEMLLANDGDVAASTGGWPMVLYRWAEQRWLPVDGDQGAGEPSGSIEEVAVTVEPGDQQVIAHVDTEALEPGWYGVYAKLQLGGRGGAVEVHEPFGVTAQ